MPHDANNKKLRVGHRVMLPLTIQEITSDHPGTCNIKATDSKGNVVAYDSSAVVLHPDERAADDSFTPPLPDVIKSSLTPEQRGEKPAEPIRDQQALDSLEPKELPADQVPDNRGADEKAADAKLNE
jgi:hypothetical protein